MQTPELCPAKLEHQILTLASQLNVTEYHLIKHLDAFDEMGGWWGDGIKSFAHWLNWKVGMGSVMAREKIRVAKALRVLPLIDAAFESGQVSYTKVRAMTRVATATNESLLLQIAEYGTAQQLELLVRKFRSLKQQELDAGSESAGDQTPTCSWFEDDQEMVTFKIRLPKEDALIVISAMNKIADQLYQPPANDNVSAETSVSDEQPDRSACRARALTLLAEQNSTAPELVLHLQANPHNLEYKINNGPLAYDDDGASLSHKSLHRLTCDCTVTTAIEDEKGHILDVGRKSRVIPPSLRRVLKQRDGGCRFPGCTQTRFTDAHHIKHWIDGGETNLDNLVMLCRHHHTRLHQGKFSIDHNGDALKFVNASGNVLPASFFPQFDRSSPMPLKGQPVRSKWEGDALDLDHVLWLMDDVS